MDTEKAEQTSITVKQLSAGKTVNGSTYGFGPPVGQSSNTLSTALTSWTKHHFNCMSSQLAI